MIRRYGRVLRALLMVLDALSAAAIVMAVYWLRLETNRSAPATSISIPLWAPIAVYSLAWVALLFAEGQYRLRAHWSWLNEAGGILRAAVWLGLASVGVLFLVDLDGTSRLYVLLLFPLQAAVTLAGRITLRAVFQLARQRGMNLRFVLVLGTDDRALDFARQVEEHSALGLRVIGLLGERPPVSSTRWRYLGTPDRLPLILREQVVDEVIICLPEGAWEVAHQYALHCQEEGKIVRIPLEVPSLSPARRFVEDLEGTTVLSFIRGPDQALGLLLKRCIDLVVSALALALLSPLLLAIAAYIRLRDGGPVSFGQTRVGEHGRTFRMWKFRTMTADAEERLDEVSHLNHMAGAAFKAADDPRITRSGRLLRRMSLDELPQLWNVLKGEMSLVGPRPAPPREVDNYDIWQRRRLSMKPGMTGLWQVTSRREQDFDRRAQLDLLYIDEWSFWLDLRILLRTLPVLARGTGQ